MQCEYGGEVTFTLCEPGYRLRIYAGTTISVILSKDDVLKLQQRICDVLREDDNCPACGEEDKPPSKIGWLGTSGTDMETHDY
jgi:hypothetical protein